MHSSTPWRVTVLAAMFSASALGADDGPVQPVWVVESSATIAWAASAGSAATSPLLFATTDGVYVLDPRAGVLLNNDPLIRTPDARLAQAAAAPLDLAEKPLILFDRHHIWGLRCSAPSAVAWTIHEDVQDAQQERGDPEYLPRWIDVASVGSRGLAINADGRIIGFDVADGHVRWRAETAPLAVATLHVSEHLGVVAAKSGPAWQAIFLSLESPEASLQRVNLGTDAPRWSAVAGDQLLIAAGDRVVCVSADGTQRTVAEGVADSPRTAIASWCGVAATTTMPGSGPRLALVRSGELVTYDVASGRALERTALVGLDRAARVSLTTAGDTLFVESDRRIWAFGRDGGRAPRILDVDGPYVCEHRGDEARVLVLGEDGRRLEIRTIPGSLSRAERGTRRLALPPDAPAVRDVSVAWRPDSLVLIAGKTLISYPVAECGR